MKTLTKKKRAVRARGPRKAARVETKATVLVLRTCDENMCGYGGFKWPTSGPIEAPDWKPTKECGNGLHGALWGEGNGELFNWKANAKWLVVEVEADSIIDLRGKVKFPRCVVVHCGDRLSATEFVCHHGGIGRAIVGGTATAGDSGTATAGYSGTATAGDSGTATAGDRGTATAGDSGTVCVRYWDEKASRYRLAIGYVGEDGIMPKTKYKVEDSKLVEAK